MTSKILILNVDDYDQARYVKTRLLQNAGFLVEEASNGSDALEMAARLHPSLVLLDVRLPDIDGREVCRRIKADPATSRMNVIHTSAAFISEQDAREGLASGADRYIPVPFEPQDLIAAVRAVLH
ncbi:response regulator transcription factor [Massilia sp. GCM10023247]|uniref:response regulator transcription factor n=1 Tax=Massilia sp. GCM10023247 TaxID=3252643 RepID=UPI00361897A2